MTDRDRLDRWHRIMDRIVEAERLRHYHSCRCEAPAAEMWAERLRVARVEADALLAEGVTLPPPPPDPAATARRDGGMMDAKARLVDVLSVAMLTPHTQKCGVLADAVLAEFDLTPKPPQPAGPVTSEATVRAFIVPVDTYIGRTGPNFGVINNDAMMAYRLGLDAAMPLLARDHGLLAPAEVERRARVWMYGRGWASFGDPADDLVAALTRADGGGK